jgi:hypothetical protein
VTVLVTGPSFAGVSSLVTVLAERLPATRFAEVVPDVPQAVVFAVSAVAPLAESDCVLLDRAAARTDIVIGVVTKVDTHHGWRAVLAADRDIVGRRAARYAELPWLGVAAAPEFGAPWVDELVDLLAGRLADSAPAQRGTAEPAPAVAHHDAADVLARMAALRRRREDLRRDARLSRAHRGLALRGGMQRARVELLYLARTRCARLRAELQDDVAGVGRRGFSPFEARVRASAAEVVACVGEEVVARLGEVAAELGLPGPPPPEPAPAPDVGGPPRHTRRLETRLMTLFGAGFGMGVALGVSRLVAGLDPRLALPGMVAGGAVGLALMVWVVGIRGLLHDRMVLDRWAGEVCLALRSGLEEMVATRVLAAELALTRSLVADAEAAAARAAGQVAHIDARLRELGARSRPGGESVAVERFAGPKQTVTDQ